MTQFWNDTDGAQDVTATISIRAISRNVDEILLPYSGKYWRGEKLAEMQNSANWRV